MEIKRNIISNRYLNDGVILENLNLNQKKSLELFLNDKRIKYRIISECTLCGTKNSILIAEKDRYAVPLETVVCENCGLIRSYKQLDKESLKIFYSDYYRNIYDPFDENALDARYELGSKKKIFKYLTKDKIILEIGCGGGWNLISFHNKGYKYYGFDFDKKFIEYGRKKGLNLYLGGVEEAIKMAIKCDYLLLDQVLEHVEDPIIFLNNIKSLLKEGALVNIYVPSLNLFPWGYLNYDLLRTLQGAHNFLFDEFTLETTGRIAGFKVANCFASNLVLKNLQDSDNLFLENLNDLNRGKKTMKQLKLIERRFSLMKKIRIDKFSFKKFYCFLKPTRCYKRIKIDYLGKI